MSVFKSVCFSLFVCVLFTCNVGCTQGDMSAYALYEKGEQSYNQGDFKNAMQWYLKSADKGDTYAMMMVGYFYQEGLGVKKDYQQGTQWLLKAADNGDIGAMINIAYFYKTSME